MAVVDGPRDSSAEERTEMSPSSDRGTAAIGPNVTTSTGPGNGASASAQNGDAPHVGAAPTDSSEPKISSEAKVSPETDIVARESGDPTPAPDPSSGPASHPPVSPPVVAAAPAPVLFEADPEMGVAHDDDSDRFEDAPTVPPGPAGTAVEATAVHSSLPESHPPPSFDDAELMNDDDIVDQLDAGSQEGTSLAELLSGEADPFEDHTDGEISIDAFRPPSIPGIRTEVTKPIRLRSKSGEAILSAQLPTVVAQPERGARGESTESLLDELSGPLGDKTVDLILPHIATREAIPEAESDESMTMEGAPFDEGTDVTSIPPSAGTILAADDGGRIVLEETLGEQRGSVFYRARIDGDDQAFTAVWSTEARGEPPWALLPDPRIVRPRARATLPGAAVRVFDRPKGNTVVDFLAQVDRPLPAMAAIELGIELAEILEGLHGAGLFLWDLDPSQVVIERGGRVRLYAIGGFFRQGQPLGHLAGIFAAPEVRRRYTYLTGAHSDVYAVALLIYSLLARRAPIDADLDATLLTSPRVFRPECPLGIWPHLRPCLDPLPSRRVGHARGLRQALARARARLLTEAQAAQHPRPLLLEAWAELHTGLGKARRGAAQQDRATAVTDESGTAGLYVVADGVSRSRYGDGAFAAEQVSVATAQRWSALEKAGPAAVQLSHGQRVDVLRQITKSAGKRVAVEVNAKCGPLPNEPNQVMSATITAAYIVAGEATVANLGDSRSYLIRDRTMERISIDHDRATDALRMGLTFREAADVKMGAALTRVVGRVMVDQEGVAHPDPFEPEVFRVQLLPGDRLVLCSDGVPDFAAGPGADQAEAEARMLEVVLAHDDPARAAFEMVVLANRGGGYDNISAIVIAVHAG